MSYDKFAQYDAYKNSGVGWLGDVPEHWEVKRLKDISPKITTGSTPSKEVFVESGFKWYTPGDFNNRLVLEQARKEVIGKPKTKIYPANSILIVSIGATLGKIGIAKNSFSANQQINIVYPAHSYFPFYLLYFLSASTDSMKASSNASTLGIMNQSKTGQLLVFIPPLQEQKAIADYLYTKTEQIDRKIDLLTQKATQYGKLKQSLINETVTRGLDKTVAMKDSGVEWIGEMPEHWQVRRVKELGNLVLGKMLDNNYGAGKLFKRYLKSKNIGWLVPNVTSVEEMYFSPYEIRLYRIKQRDLLFSEGGEVGKTSFWNNDVEECYIQNSVHKLTINRFNYSRYFMYLSYTAGHSGYYDSIVNFVSIKHLTKEKLSRVIWPVPSIQEQKAIADYLDTKTAHVDRIIETINTQIEKLKELRKTLINDVVTGKIKVA